MMKLIAIFLYCAMGTAIANSDVSTSMNGYAVGIHSGYQKNSIALRSRDVRYGTGALGIHLDRRYLAPTRYFGGTTFFTGWGMDGTYNFSKTNLTVGRFAVTLVKTGSFAVTVRGGIILKQIAWEANWIILLTHFKHKIVDQINPNSRLIVNDVPIGNGLGVAITAPLSDRLRISLNYRYEIYPLYVTRWRFHVSHNTFVKLSYLIKRG